MRLRLSARSIVLIGIAVGIVTLCLAPAAMAQSGGIAVCVVDDEGEPLAGATVEISSSRQLTKTTAQLTGASGCTQFPVLRVGAGYELLVSMPGFSSYVLPNIRVRSGQQIPQKIALTAELTERVQVFGRTEVVDLSDATSTTKFDDTFIENLPVSGRFYQNVLALAPGVQDDDGDGNPNVHGSRERNFRAVVDGVANTDPLTGEWLSLLNTDAIEEMEIVGTGAGVEYGRASGGFARIVQKQGSNDFEGLFSFIWRSSELDGGAPGDIGGTPKSDSYEWLQPAFQLSGPIIKDKLWYRLSHEWIDREDPIVTLSGSMNTGRKQTIISDQLTWQVSPRNKLSFTYQEDPTTITNFGVSSRVPASSSQRVERGGPTFKVNWTAPLSPRLLVDSTFAYQDLDRGFFPTNPDQANSCALYGEFGGGFEPLNRASCLDDRTGVVSGAASDTWQDRRQRLTVSSQATLFINKFLGMSHRLKFGFGSENERYFRSLTRTPSMNFLVEVPPIGTPIGRSFVRASAPNSVANAATGNNWSAYLEDQFRPVQNLSITMGLRFDREEIFAPGQQTFDPAAESEEYQRRRESFPNANPGRLATTLFTGFADVQQFQFLLAETLGASLSQLNLGAGAAASTFWVRQRQEGEMQIINNNVSPRFSIAWDPFGNAKTKVSASAGRYYDKIFLAVPLIELEPPTTELEFNSIPVRGRYISIGLSSAFDPSIIVNTVSRDLRTPYQDEWTLAFEHSIGTETSLSATYIRRRFRDQIQDVDINHAPGDKGRCRAGQPIGQGAAVLSPGIGDQYFDPFTGVFTTDTDPGIGDGVLDDCTGIVVREGGLFGQQFEVADGVPDLYTLNPGWGEILQVGNFNSTDYEAFVIELERRMYRNWQLAASYTWSEAIGDSEDFNQILGNERNLFDQERGLLSFDQTHVVKINTMKILSNGLRLGGVLRWESGTPYSYLESRQTIWAVSPLYENFGDTAQDFRLRYPSGARNDLRNSSYWTIDMRMAKEFQPRPGLNLQVTAEAFNLLDDQTLVVDDRIGETITATRRFGRQFQIGIRTQF